MGAYNQTQGDNFWIIYSNMVNLYGVNHPFKY